MLSSLATLPSLAFYNQTSGPAPTPTITFTSGGSGAVQGTQNGFNFVRFQSTGNYSFTMSNFNNRPINIVVVGGGGGGQMGQVLGGAAAFGGSGGSGGQTLLVNNYTPSSSSISCTARVGLGGIGTYYGNGGLGTSGGVAVEGGNTSGTVYGTTTNNNPENSVSTGQIKCGGGYSEIVASGIFTLRALGGNFGSSTPSQGISSNTCPSTGQTVTGITATFYQGKAGGNGATGSNTGGAGTNGQTISVAGTNLVFGSSGGGACRDQLTQSATGTNAGKASGSTAPTSYTGYRNPNQWDGFPATANYGAGGGGASGSGGTPYNTANANYNNLHGGNGSSGVVWIWWA